MFVNSLIGKRSVNCINGVEVRRIPKPRTTNWLQTYGTLDGGGELMRLAWTSMNHVFAMRRPGDSISSSNFLVGKANTNTSTRPDLLVGEANTSTSTISDLLVGETNTIIKYGYQNYPFNLLKKHPVDLLVVERIAATSPPEGALASTSWEAIVKRTPIPKRPKVILESWVDLASTWARGPLCKINVTRWRNLGYETHCKDINGTDVGGAIDQKRLIIARVRLEESRRWQWPPIPDGQAARPMSNLLTPAGLVPRHLYISTALHPKAVSRCASFYFQ